MSDEKIKASLYIDGNFTVHIHKYLAKNFSKTIEWNSFTDFVKERIAKETGKICLLESQFFVGTGIKTTDPERDYLFNSMEHAGITKHATPLKQKVSGGLKEDAVDTNLVFYATQDYYKRGAYDYLVLIAGDSDFVPLVKGLASEAVKTFVIYMDFTDDELGKTQTSQSLLDSTDIRESIESLRLERVDEKIKSIFIDYEGCFIKNAVDTTDSESDVVTTTKSTTIKKKVAKNSTTSDVPFTKEQLIDAIKNQQKESDSGKNEFVLLSKVGLFLRKKTGVKLHGKVISTIKKNYPEAFEIDESKKGAEKIRLAQ
ncbi:MAG: NYN domain-containing protein [Treponema sp.]|nr:NYN domain-containing protein [Treponema sp.]